MNFHPICRSSWLRQSNRWFLAANCLVWICGSLQAQVPIPFSFATNNNSVTITSYDYSVGNGHVTIPDTIDGLPVTTIGPGAFYDGRA